MKTHYLVFPSEAAALTALPELKVDREWTPYLPSGQAVAVVGVHYSKTGKILTGADGIQYPEMVAAPGFHINLSDVPPDSISAFEVFPASPSQVFG